MLASLFRKKKLNKNVYIPPCLENLSVIQDTHYKKFRDDLNKFYLGKGIENPNNDILYIGIDDGYLGSISVGEITPNGVIHLKFPEPGSIDSDGFRYILDGTL